MPTTRLPLCRQRRGATMVLIALLMIVLLAMVAFAVDVGRMFLTNSQLQAAVDSGALAASLQLKVDGNDIDAAIASGRDFVQLNRVGSFVTIPENAIQIEAGNWDAVSKTFSSGSAYPRAVRVVGTLDSEPFFFARVLGQTTFGVTRSAVALSGGSKLDVIMTLDLSGSMGSQGRIEALRDAAPTFVDVIEEVGDDDRIGVMGYGAIPSLYDPVAKGHNGVSYLSAPSSLYPSDSDWCGVLEAALTDDFNFLRGSVLNSGTLIANKYNGWTPVGAALRDSAHYLTVNARSGVDKVIVLMSDGLANKPDGNGRGYALDMAAYAAGQNIKVYTISLGNAADEDLMQQIADNTGAEHFVASGSGGGLSDVLTEAFKNIANAIKQTQLVE